MRAVAPKLSLEARTQAEAWINGQEGRKLRLAGEDDLEAVHALKTLVIKETFPAFLNGDEVVGELADVCSAGAVRKMILENQVLLAERNSELIAIGALGSGPTIFSCYSLGDRAGTAIILELLSMVGDEAESILCWIYAGNRASKRLFADIGFENSGAWHRSSAAPRVPVEHWTLNFR